MAVSDAWHLLGLSPTDDRRAVKRAYATKLKAIDPDNDPVSFRTLREAFELATGPYGLVGQYDETGSLKYLGYHTTNAHIEFTLFQESNAGIPNQSGIVKEQDPAPEPESSVTPEPELEPEPEPEPEPELEPEPEPEPRSMPQPPIQPRVSVNFGSVQAIATPDDPEQLILHLLDKYSNQADRDAQLSDATQTLLNDPAMAGITRTLEIEEWLIDLIASRMPDSDPMIAHAVAHFNWKSHAGKVDTTDSLEAILRRNDHLETVERLMNPDHRWHSAFETLKRPLGYRGGQTLDIDLVDEFLRSIRLHNEEILELLDVKHVSNWDIRIANTARWAQANPISRDGSSDFGTFIGLAIAFMLVTKSCS